MTNDVVDLMEEFCYQVDFLRKASNRIKMATPVHMQSAIAHLDKTIEGMVEALNRRLNEIGDVDPRESKRS